MLSRINPKIKIFKKKNKKKAPPSNKNESVNGNKNRFLKKDLRVQTDQDSRKEEKK